MAVKLADTLAPMGDFEIAKAKDVSIELTDGSTSDVETVLNDFHDSLVDYYSTTETKTNKVWIDGKPIYRTVVSCGKLPNATTKSVSHGIANLHRITSIKGITYNPNLGTSVNLPHVDERKVESNIYISVGTTNIELATGIDRSVIDAWAILEYTKTTD